MNTNISEWFEADIASRPYTALIFYRGKWCPFCEGQIRELNGRFLKDLRALGGELYAVTSQSQEGVDQAAQDWALDYKIVSDVQNTLAQRFDIAVSPKEMPGEYPNGMVQPGVVILDRTGAVLVQWAIDPQEINGFGALGRPTPEVIWAAFTAARNGSDAVTFDGPTVDPAFLQAKYPAAYEAFDAWMKANA
ncbi:redoxin domain-containing protein [Tateyamaria sp. syn59]|uniref:redoxin domain-containing protein n=1 Tax=Tateyamaria sp. syn59 TaxID=2576942 RepID=UPI00167C2872|nr:redoxin domain-containing protein [Tateyamaria sp. syn59]